MDEVCRVSVQLAKLALGCDERAGLFLRKLKWFQHCWAQVRVWLLYLSILCDTCVKLNLPCFCALCIYSWAACGCPAASFCGGAAVPLMQCHLLPANLYSICRPRRDDVLSQPTRCSIKDPTGAQTQDLKMLSRHQAYMWDCSIC